MMEQVPLHKALFAEPQVIAHCGGKPILAYGYTWVVSDPPDLAPAPVPQVGNAAAMVKVPVKRSSEIVSNRMGVNSSRMPHSTAVDYLPLEAIHLIDGDPTTCWCSHTSPSADADSPWIRIDLVAETAISRIVLRKRVPGAKRNVPGSMPLDEGAVEIGMAMPGEISVSLSRDAETWETVVTAIVDDDAARREFTFDARGRIAKQILIDGRHLCRLENWLFGFSIASVEVYDMGGVNVALATRGAGVSVSSTQHVFGQTIEAHRQLWPMSADLGVKWVRVGYHDDPVNWHWVERERGKLEVDYETDASITWLAENGIDTVIALGFGNRLYTQTDPARHLPQLWEWYYENPAPPTTPDALEAWGRYVRFMARHFRDRVKCFEIWNEWNGSLYFGGEASVERYVAIARVAIDILREEAPEATVSVGGYAGWVAGIAKWPDGKRGPDTPNAIFLDVVERLASEVDAIQWHPFYQTSPEADRYREYPADVRAFQAYCHKHGFRGEYIASEWTYGASYPPPTPPNWWGSFVCSELQKAKYVAQMTVRHVGLGVTSIFCEQWNDNYPLDLSLLRRSTFSDPQSRQQPQAAYYAMRNLSTALDSLEPAEVDHRIDSGQAEVEVYTFVRGGERMIAIWTPGLATDDCVGTAVDVAVEGLWDAYVYDTLNGDAAPLNVTRASGETVIAGLLVKDYPLLLTLTART